MRKPFIAGNWKMYGQKAQVSALVAGIKQGIKPGVTVDVVLLPTFIHLLQVQELITHTPLQLGAQNLYLGAQGAFTGEISGPMLVECGCQYVLIGHSERRAIFHENLALVAEKFKAALQAGLQAILCVGETKAEREQGQTNQVIEAQLQSVISSVGIESFRQAVIAYEPVWAIGTGLTATPEQAQAVHAFIRRQIAQNNVDIAKTIRILYGGSLKPENAASLFAMQDIDGGLVGGASLDAASFLAICEVAMLKTANVFNASGT